MRSPLPVPKPNAITADETSRRWKGVSREAATGRHHDAAGDGLRDLARQHLEQAVRLRPLEAFVAAVCVVGAVAYVAFWIMEAK